MKTEKIEVFDSGPEPQLNHCGWLCENAPSICWMALDPYAAAIVGIVNGLVQMNCVRSVPQIKQNSRSLLEFVGIEGHIDTSVPCNV